jgi:archaellum component FlaD/FlaE
VIAFGLPLRMDLEMAINVKLSEALVEEARRSADADHRSLPRQIEFYYRIGKIAEENPDLSFKFIRDIMKSDAEESTSAYKFG